MEARRCRYNVSKRIGERMTNENSYLLKYRVYDILLRRYITERVFVDSNGAVRLISSGEYYNHGTIVEHSTGLRDRNGTLIYAGDVVLFVGKVNLAVQYTPNGWEMAGDDVNVPLTENTARFVKIVGNIHEQEATK